MVSKHYNVTREWLHQMTHAREKNNIRIVEQFEESFPDMTNYDQKHYQNEEHSSSSDQKEVQPINILCFDGGGMRGYGYLAMLQVISQEYCKEGSDFFGQFDLIAGTSVGGIGALIVNGVDTVDEFLFQGRDLLDEIREQCFEKTSLWRLLWTGSLVEKHNQIQAIVSRKFGTHEPLANDRVPAMALCSVDSKSQMDLKNGEGNGSSNRTFQPFVVRTYDYPNQKSASLPLAESTNSITLCEAMAATSSFPSITDRVTIQFKEKTRSLADGGIFAISPVPIAIDEAKRLYPNRPLGVILSLGFTKQDSSLIHRTIETARLNHPGLHFQRVEPDEIMSKFPFSTTDVGKIAVMEEEVRRYMRETTRVRNGLLVTMRKLFEHESIRMETRTREKKPGSTKRAYHSGPINLQQMSRESISFGKEGGVDDEDDDCITMPCFGSMGIIKLLRDKMDISSSK